MRQRRKRKKKIKSKKGKKHQRGGFFIFDRRSMQAMMKKVKKFGKTINKVADTYKELKKLKGK